MGRLVDVDHSISWLRQFSETITAHNESLDWKGVRAYACNFLPSQQPLVVPSDADYLTLEINTALSATISYQFGDRDGASLYWQPGDIWIYPNSEPSRWTWDNPHSTVVILLPYARLRQVIMDGRDASFHHPALIPGISRHDRKLRNLLHLIAQEMDDERSNGPQYISSLADATLVHLSKNYVAESKDYFEGQYFLSSVQLESIKEFVSDRLDEPISVADLADTAGVRSSEFPRAFRATIGTTPYQYVMQERINWCAELLRTSDMSLAEISYATGFSSQSHFTRTFRKQKSVTPMTYRRIFAGRPGKIEGRHS